MFSNFMRPLFQIAVHSYIHHRRTALVSYLPELEERIQCSDNGCPFGIIYLTSE